VPDFYTRDGDDGTTGLLGSGRVPKYHPRPEAYGAVDEAAAALGLARSLTKVAATRETVEAVQRDLYRLMAEVAATVEEAERFRAVGPERVEWLEAAIRQSSAGVKEPTGFILGGDTPGAAAFDLARTVVRRAEREVARLTHEGQLTNPSLLQYLNRLSSLCFVLTLAEIQAEGLAGPTLARPPAS
jgi:cob(I)alamin adenosyltransferase